jgi:hypothetical protein
MAQRRKPVMRNPGRLVENYNYEDASGVFCVASIGYLAMTTDASNRSSAVNPLALDLDMVLSQLDSETALLLERTVRDALALAKRRAADGRAIDALGYPAGYFEATAGSFADEPLEAPNELPMQTREAW